MKASELRIGNLIFDNYSGVMMVSTISLEHIHLRKNENFPTGQYNIKSLKPILLTEEWLLKFGFKPRGEGYSIGGYILCDFRDFSDGSSSYILYNWDSYNEIEITVKDNIRYVHQLQNLWFALNEEELIKSE